MEIYNKSASYHVPSGEIAQISDPEGYEAYIERQIGEAFVRDMLDSGMFEIVAKEDKAWATRAYSAHVEFCILTPGEKDLVGKYENLRGEEKDLLNSFLSYLSEFGADKALRFLKADLTEGDGE